MSTIEASLDAHDHDEHDHPPFLAHHFDTPEQQFDSGKLGIWLFLVQEILFFSGMFCAYAIYRSLRPEVFEGCSQFLNTRLGAINTCVLLFSSLTMALGVRCAQVEDHKGLTRSLTATLCCAMIFLGVKAIEYSHKWGMGLLPPAFYFFNPDNPHPTVEQMEVALGDNAGWASFFAHGLFYMCLPVAIMTIGVFIWLVLSIIRNNKFQADCAKPLFLVCLSFFAGVYLGTLLESGEEEGHSGEHHVAADVDGLHAEGEQAHLESGHAVEADHADSEGQAYPSADDSLVALVTAPGDPILELLAKDKTNSGVQSKLDALNRQSEVAGTAIVNNNEDVTAAITEVEQMVHSKRRAGVFFAIYYMMTGIHAIHIIGGIVVLVWLLFRSVRMDFNKHYFGPVDYVGLYWHLVDLVWIYLFPLLYLIR
jgi:cytochrome c oxidase subunit 3